MAPGVKLRWNEAANPKTGFDMCARVLQRGPLHARQPAVSACGSLRGWRPRRKGREAATRGREGS